MAAAIADLCCVIRYDFSTSDDGKHLKEHGA